VPGWGPATYGWHGDDGALYLQCDGITGYPLSKPWDSGDTVGFGIALDTTPVSFFFTLNGEIVDPPESTLRRAKTKEQKKEGEGEEEEEGGGEAGETKKEAKKEEAEEEGADEDEEKKSKPKLALPVFTAKDRTKFRVLAGSASNQPINADMLDRYIIGIYFSIFGYF